MSVTGLKSKAGLARKVGTIGLISLRDKIRPATATKPEEVPPSAAAITPAWLTGVLCADTPGAAVLHVETRPASTGSTARSRLLVTYNEAGRTAGLPRSVFVKSTTSFTSRLAVGMTGAAEGESRFYSQIRPAIDVLAPEGYYGRAERRSGRSIILLEDIAETRGATFGDATDRYVDRAMAESLVRTLAQVHGALWDSPRFRGDLSWLQTSEQVQRSVNGLMDFEGRCLVGIDRAGDVLPAPVRALGPQLMPALFDSLACDRGKPLGLVHTDVHSGNWFCTPEGEMGLYDWQALAKGQGFRDLAYALMSNLTIADRREWERDLVEMYVDALGSAGGTPPDLETAWLSYRQQTLHGLCYWLFTLGAGRLQPAMQRTAVSLVNLERMGQALVDLDSIRALDDRSC